MDKRVTIWHPPGMADYETYKALKAAAIALEVSMSGGWREPPHMRSEGMARYKVSTGRIPPHLE